MVSYSIRYITALFLLASTFSAHGADGQAELESAFQIQGEYVGRIVHPELPIRSGLQVVATSATTFDAYLLDGGLPGDGWDGQGRMVFPGSGNGNAQFERSDSPLVMRYLKQFPGIIFVYLDGYRIGTLRKVYRNSPTLGLPAPENAIVLFRDQDQHRLKNVTINPNGTLGIGAETVDQVHNVRLHVEFRTPFEPEKEGQGRGNSGVYIQRRYEVQILDSFGLDLEPNRCGGLYKQKSADISMAFSSTYLTECFVVGDLVDFYLIQQVRRIYFDEDANAGLLRVSKPKTQRTSYRQQCQ